MYIHCHTNILTKPLHSNDKRIHIQTHRLMGRIYEAHHRDGLICHGMHTTFHKLLWYAFCCVSVWQGYIMGQSTQQCFETQ
jgi:hypothetical protein